MKVRKIFLVSPREPSGATWLINCFLELGIMTYRINSKSMWKKEGNRFTLTNNERILKKWLPALSTYNHFNFIKDLEIEWTHDWPTSRFRGYQVVYFVRDPRDAIFSRYKRENPKQTFRQFVDFPDPLTLLDKISRWCVFNYSWLAHDNITVIRFEDYKKDALGLLKQVLSDMAFKAAPEAIVRAAGASTFEKAAEAERKYRREHTADDELINRSGRPGNWKEACEDGGVIHQIESKCGELLSMYGYDSRHANSECVHIIPRLSIFRNLITFPACSVEYEKTPGKYLLDFIRDFCAETLTDSNLRDYEIPVLIETLIEYCFSNNIQPTERIVKAYDNVGNRSRYYFMAYTHTGNYRYLAKVNPFYMARMMKNRILNFTRLRFCSGS